MSLEKPSAKDFGFEVLSPDREHGTVPIVYAGQKFIWFLREDGRTLVLRSGDVRTLSDEVREAMQKQARAILEPAWELHNLKHLRP